jgi:hypothetical protein
MRVFKLKKLKTHKITYFYVMKTNEKSESKLQGSTQRYRVFLVSVYTLYIYIYILKIISLLS